MNLRALILTIVRWITARSGHRVGLSWGLPVTALICLSSVQNASAEEISVHSYSQAEGLSNLGVRCLRQDQAGYMFACTEHGAYVYDGRRFSNLGLQQGLPEGGYVTEIVPDAGGKVILRYFDRVFVSQGDNARRPPPQAMRFRAATSSIGALFNDRVGQMASWGNGAILIEKGRLNFVDPGTESQPPRIAPLAERLRQPDGLITDATLVASGGANVWVALSDGRICSLNMDSERCYQPASDLPAETWRSLLVLADGSLLARSRHHLATIRPDSGRIEQETLPFQGEHYEDYSELLTLAQSPSGEILTQSDDGMMIRSRSGWRNLSASSGLPSGPLTAVLFDHEKNLWLGIMGLGAFRELGYGLWQNRKHPDGLSDDVVWHTVRQPGGPLWVASDRGVDALDVPSSAVVAKRHYDGPGFALAVGTPGHLWRSMTARGVACINTADGVVHSFQMPAVNQILHGLANRLWFATQNGLYFVDDVPGDPSAPARVAQLDGPFPAAATAEDGSLWLLSNQRLLHLHPDGAVEVVVKEWGVEGFSPYALALALDKQGAIWVGGLGGGLFRVVVDAAKHTSIVRFEPPDILSNTAVALLVDRRGWLWAGTDSGVSVYDGKRWVSANVGTGLVWNDVNQGGITEDQDGSIWISTSQGLSHLLDPARLFQRQIMQPVITSIVVGDKPFEERALPFSRGALDIAFGTLNFQQENSVRFHYRLDGFDTAWADTSSGNARYPYLPWGHHRFTISAYDELTHQESPPVTVLLRMHPPWWRWWPLEVGYLLLFAASVYGVWRLRFSYLLRQRRILQQTVEMRTMEIHAAHEALLLQASQDSLTRLLTRGEIQKRLLDALAHGKRPLHLTVGLLDIDHFKRINDRFGHLAGDEILREIGQRLNMAMRHGEHAGRYGGEEILIVVSGERTDGVGRLRELNAALCQRPFLVEDEVIQVTCSTGVARAFAHDSWKTLIGRADRALYHAKESGRDQVVEAPGDQIVSRNAS